MQSFLGKINFMRRFISDFVEIIKPLQEMIKKDSNFKWTKERKEAFDKIKEAIAELPLYEVQTLTMSLSYTHLLPIIQLLLC